MSEKTLKLGNVIVNKKDFHTSKKSIALNLVDIEKVVTSDNFKHSDKGFKYFVGYKKKDIIKPLCIVLSQMSECNKYFDNDEKICLLKTVLVKFNEIWNKIKKT